MKAQILSILSFTLLVSSLAGANSGFLGRAPERGIIITVSPDKIPSKSNEKILIKGTIKVSGKQRQDEPSEKSKDHSAKDGLLEEFKKQGIDIVGTFPSSVVDISGKLNLQSISDDEIQYSFQSENLAAEDLNQFSLKVYNNHKDKEPLKKLSRIQAKLEKRLQLLTDLKKKYENGKALKEVIAVFEREIAKLSTLITKISDRINSDGNLMAENTYSIQVDNLTANYSKISTVMNKFRFVIESDLGTAIEGMKANFKSRIVYLSKSSGDIGSGGDSTDGDDAYLAEFYFNNQKITSKKIEEARKSINLSVDFSTESLKPSDQNTFAVALYRLDEGQKYRRIGYLNQKIPVVGDSVKPLWLAESIPDSQDRYVKTLRPIDLKAQDPFGRIDASTFRSVLTGTLVSGANYSNDLTSKLSIKKIGDGWGYEWGGDLNPLEEGEYSLNAKVSDQAQNESDSFNTIFRIDRTSPVVEIRLVESTLTNKMSYEVPVFVSDLSPTFTDIYVNDVLFFTTGSKAFPAVVNLNREGNNTIRVVSTDAAGNVSQAEEVIIVRDTTLPILAIDAPKDDDYVNGVQFSISALSDEPIKEAKVNGQVLTLASNKASVTGTFTSLHEGPLALNFEATDIAGNTSYKVVNVNVVLKALNPELLSIMADPKSNTLIVKGAAGATRPGVKVNASSSIFNSGEAIGDKDGGFSIVLNPFTEVEVSAYDPLIDKTEKVILRFGTPDGNLLAGTVRDIDGQPLVGAKVSLANTNISVNTDENGIFKFTQDMTGGKLIYGDQNLIVDGRTITQATGENQRKFSIVQLAITISLNQTNVLQRPIYLAPIVLDGTETQVSVDAGATVTSPHAPGVSLDIPAGSIEFPDGAAEAAVSMQEISADKSTILPIQAAMPKSVVALEPSGTTFSKPVDLTLPNKNEFAPNAELVILLMNSKTGKWEVGGAAVVSESGQSIVTKPGQGIRHFSLAYAAPLGPTVRPVGAKDKPGADTFDGAVATRVSIPAFKSLGETVGAGLVYKSSWAKPTVLVTNLFDMSTRKVEVTIPEQSGSLVDKVKVNLPYCSLKTELFGSAPTADDIKCVDNIQEFLYNIQYKVSYKNTQSVMTPEKIVASFQTANIKSMENDPNLVFTGLPDMAAISYGMELKDTNSNEYLSSGIYPYTAHYDLHFKEMTIGTRVVEQKVNLGEPQISEEAFSSDEIQKVFPQDLVEPLYVQNYSKSEAGRGWRISGIQKIVNPSGDRIMIEEESGDIATYSLANTIDTLADLTGKGDLGKGVGLNMWPAVQYMDSQSGQYKQIDLTSGQSSIVAPPHSLTGVWLRWQRQSDDNRL